MQFTEAPDEPEAGMYCRRVSGTGLVEVGVYPVLYGFRVRSGFVGALTCECDWCAGSEWKYVQLLYSAAISILSRRDESRTCFNDIPETSRIKPYYNDNEFVMTLCKMCDFGKDIIKLDSTAVVNRNRY